MNYTVIFYRLRSSDAARATIAQETVEADDLERAMQIAKKLLDHLDAPQKPDGVAIQDAKGLELCAYDFE
ncbi:MAG: hypothetical protein JNM45_00360 [Rhizobiales bacterium]|nr:hypothetical protein [Hyphomicrobiales bacterium]